MVERPKKRAFEKKIELLLEKGQENLFLLFASSAQRLA